MKIFEILQEKVLTYLNKLKNNQKKNFFECGTKILENNGWIKTDNCWHNPNIKEFKIYEKQLKNVYTIKHNENGFKDLTIYKTENILKRISEYKIYLKSKKKKIVKDSFLNDFE